LEETVRQQILDGLIANKGGDQQISTATGILAEVIASDPLGWQSSTAALAVGKKRFIRHGHEYLRTLPSV
jgi:hypothetical protein